jgi:hypothetical protein
LEPGTASLEGKERHQFFEIPGGLSYYEWTGTKLLLICNVNALIHPWQLAGKGGLVQSYSRRTLRLREIRQLAQPLSSVGGRTRVKTQDFVL